ncbi:MAG: SAM-dependent chlorinase/fluorinase, partial [Planctomycetota bacterium]|nr:SAM-dependent chlorinase/fluorinase [Planctomycetota bacterium]
VFLGCFPAGNWVDLTHGIPPQDTRAASLELRHAYSYFPVGTLHVAIVDPGVGTSRRIIVAEKSGHGFLAPDNGLLDGILEEGDPVWAPDPAPWELPNKSSTFHGRDVFTPMAAALASGRLVLADRDLCLDWVRCPEKAPEQVSKGGFTLRILMVDHFGNLVTNWDVSQSGTLPEGAEVRIGSHVVPIVKTYADVPCMGLLALIDSIGHLEIAQRDGSAADRLGLGVGDVLELRTKP